MDGLSGTVFLFSYALATCVLRRVQPLVAVGLRGRLLGRSGKLVACLLDDGALGVLAKSGTLHAGAKTRLGAEELTVLLGLHGHVVVLDDEVGGQPAPALDQRGTLLFGVEVEIVV